ncbi:MAG: hypothetical protein ACD_43C00263G0005 [uncultured bacterium]|nr:MAG: hypothetical protein ACD_43C00263G0005 [uncultured bacterium]
MAETVVKKKKKKKRLVPKGQIHIFSSYNNTIITVTDPNGNSLAQGSAGQYGFKGPKKSTPYAAGVVLRETVEKLKETGLKEVSVLIKGIGSGRDGALRAITSAGLTITEIRDITPIPHNGCRPKKPRRV